MTTSNKHSAIYSATGSRHQGVTYRRSDWNSVMLKPGIHWDNCCSR